MEEETKVEEKEQPKLTKEQKIFAIKVIVWSLFSCFIPVAFIGWRYDLFKKAGELSLSGWGLFAIVIIAIFLYVVIKYIKAGFTEWSMTKQIISGIIKVLLPLGASLAVVVSIRANLDYFIQALSCVLMCEVIAIPVNPFPEWVWKKSQGRFESAVDFIANKIYNKKDNKGE